MLIVNIDKEREAPLPRSPKGSPSTALFTGAATLLLFTAVAPAAPGKARCKCPKRCSAGDPDGAPIIRPGAEARWRLLTAGTWQRAAGKRSPAQEGETLRMTFDREGGAVWITAPSLEETGHGVGVRLCEITPIQGGLALRLMDKLGGFGDLWALLRDRPQPGPGSHPAISCCQRLKVRIKGRGKRIQVLGKTFRQAKNKAKTKKTKTQPKSADRGSLHVAPRAPSE